MSVDLSIGLLVAAEQYIMAERFIISKFSFMFLLMLGGVVLEARAGKKEEKNVFILYMGAAPSMPAGASATDMHSQLLASVLKRLYFNEIWPSCQLRLYKHMRDPIKNLSLILILYPKFVDAYLLFNFFYKS